MFQNISYKEKEKKAIYLRFQAVTSLTYISTPKPYQRKIYAADLRIKRNKWSKIQAKYSLKLFPNRF